MIDNHQITTTMLHLKLLRAFSKERFAYEREKYLRALPAVIHIDIAEKDGVFFATVSGYDSIVTFGYTRDEALRMAFDAILTFYGVPREIANDLKPKIHHKKGEVKMVDTFKYKPSKA